MPTAKFITINMAELAKRVPPNQVKQFENFRIKSFKYIRRVNQYPDKLRRIDWDYYRRNVDKDHVKLIDQFEEKYEELNHNFAKRHEVLDHSKYFTEWEKLTSEVQDELKRFMEASDNRIKIYQEEIRRIKNLNYENMTLEQFVELGEDTAQFIPGQGKPLFWPHHPEEQLGAEVDIVASEKSEKKNKDNQDEPKSNKVK